MPARLVAYWRPYRAVSSTSHPAADASRTARSDRASRPALLPQSAVQASTPTADAVWRYANAALEAGWLVAAALVPLYVDLLRAQPNLARGLLLQVLATYTALLWLTQWAAGQRSVERRVLSTEP